MDSEQIHQIRKMAGRIEERLADYGAPLSDEEDERIRGWLIGLKESTGDFGYRKRLKLAFRDFVHAAGCVLPFKSRYGADGLQPFSSADEAKEIRGTLVLAGMELISACNEIVEPAQHSPASDKALGLGTVQYALSKDLFEIEGADS